ncbi:hypothetical protein [Bacillus mycoides]|uniref:Uncharacterized protein n=1 Tax=Bacillus mycoides (strain KBAB4) TaxID=315730 RepID=A9VVI6_BACMK|nr:hypothetical protein [Bacillus mycoides]ABY46801.1 hypothetical protein BcerKBAB4_5307 [Bacillus mycoides KBAB4]
MTQVYVGASALKEMEAKKLQFEENQNSDYGVIYFIENGKLMGTNKSDGRTRERQPELDFYTTQRFVEYSELKEGVKAIVVDASGNESISLRDIVEIKEVSTITFGVHNLRTGDRIRLNKERLRVATDEDIKAFETKLRTEKFSVGKFAKVTDVKATERHNGAHSFKTGEIIKLTYKYSEMSFEGESVERLQTNSIRVEDMVIVDEETALQMQVKVAKVGDIVVILKNEGNQHSKVGDIVEIQKFDRGSEGFRMLHADGKDASYKHRRNVRMATTQEIADFNKAKEDAKLVIKQGDYARVIKNDSFRVGDVVKVGRFDGIHFSAVKAGDNDGDFHYIDERGEVEKITEEEYNEAKRKEDAKRVKRGDVVVVVTSYNRHEEGTIGKVRSRCNGHIHLNNAEGDNMGGTLRDGKYRLATSEEKAEFQKKEAEFEIQRKEKAEWAKLGREVGELRNGDVVVFGTNTYANGFDKGSIAEIRNVSKNSYGTYRFDFGRQGQGLIGAGNSTHVQEIIATKESRVSLKLSK